MKPDVTRRLEIATFRMKSTDWERYNTAFKEYKKECRVAHDKYLNDNVLNDEANPKKFYTYVKSKRQDDVSAILLMTVKRQML